MIRIVSRKDGFRRCGIEHAAMPTEYPNDRFTAEQLAQLQAEPMLVVDVLPDTPAEDAPGGETGKGKGKK